jgi:hypothetical protein
VQAPQRRLQPQHPRTKVPRLSKGSVDFFALYIIPTDDWYIIPYKVIGKRYATLHFSPDSARQKYGKYLEAWHLLVDASKGKAGGPIDLHASCDNAGQTEAYAEATKIDPAAKSGRSLGSLLISILLFLSTFANPLRTSRLKAFAPRDASQRNA